MWLIFKMVGRILSADSVWVSAMARDSSLLQLNLDYDVKDPARLAAREKRMPRDDELPATIFARYKDAPITELPEFFGGGAIAVFSGKLASPFFRHDLGDTHVVPVQILDYERENQLFAERNYHCITRFTVFEALAPDESPRIGENALGTPPPWNFPINPKGGAPNPRDGDIAVHARALKGPLIWYDEQLSGGIFFRGDLVEEMDAAGVAEHWQLKKCKIVD
ncbi:MAG: hypothetical protein AAGM21_09680 [Pseudomonadota bacterium]